ncbi:MAG: hypothetical protein ACTSYZ_05915 [Candidatus Helarchaeota archaeon]
MDKKQVLTQILNEVKNLNLNNLMIIRTNGNLLANNFPERAKIYIKNIINKYKNIPVNNYVRANVANNLNLILYKISTNIFLVCLTVEDENKVVNIFKTISKKFNYILYELYNGTQNKNRPPVSKFIKYIIFSQAGDLGPTPVAWDPSNIDDQEKFEISAKSILVLSAGLDQTNRTSMDHTTSIIPFTNLNCIGLVYTFSIPSYQARGNSLDAAISVLVHKQFKKLLLNKLEQIETELYEITRHIISGENPSKLLIILRQSIEQILSKTDNLQTHTQTLTNNLKQIMMSEIKKIQEKKPYSTLLY